MNILLCFIHEFVRCCRFLNSCFYLLQYCRPRRFFENTKFKGQPKSVLLFGPKFFLEIVFLDLKYFSKTGSLNAPKYRKIDPPYLRTCIKYYFFKSISIPQCGLLPYLGFLLGAVWAPLLRAAAAGHLLLTNQLYQDAQPCRAGTHWAPEGWGTSWPPGSSCCGCRCCCWSWGWCCQSCCPGSACLAAWWQLPPPRPRGLLLARWRHHHRACAAASAWAAASCSYPAHAPAVAWKIAILYI